MAHDIIAERRALASIKNPWARLRDEKFDPRCTLEAPVPPTPSPADAKSVDGSTPENPKLYDIARLGDPEELEFTCRIDAKGYTTAGSILFSKPGIYYVGRITQPRLDQFRAKLVDPAQWAWFLDVCWPQYWAESYQWLMERNGGQGSDGYPQSDPERPSTLGSWQHSPYAIAEYLRRQEYYGGDARKPPKSMVGFGSLWSASIVPGSERRPETPKSAAITAAHSQTTAIELMQQQIAATNSLAAAILETRKKS